MTNTNQNITKKSTCVKGDPRAQGLSFCQLMMPTASSTTSLTIQNPLSATTVAAWAPYVYGLSEVVIPALERPAATDEERSVNHREELHKSAANIRTQMSRCSSISAHFAG
jgi:hypothetical protein